MLIFPAIDLVDGKCVRLTKGDFDSTKIYNDNPVQMLQDLSEIGAKFVHIVDLDGAKKGSVAQLNLIGKLANSEKLEIQVGGGIRAAADIHNLLNLGINRVVVGSICVSNRNLVKSMLKEFGSDKIVMALDCQIDDNGTPIIKTHGWQDLSSVSAWELLDFYSDVKYVLCTDISVDGTLMGPNLELYSQIKKRYPHIQVIASGGVSSEKDLDDLRNIGMYAVVVGKAMYEGRIDMEKVLKC